jgi:hypothetical protein
MSEMFDPGWKAYVDGVATDVLRADYLLRAIAVPAGAHVVELRYEPAPLRTGIAVSLGTLLTMAVVGAVVGVRGGAPLPALSRAPVAAGAPPARGRRALLPGAVGAVQSLSRSGVRLDARVGIAAVTVLAGIFRLTRLEALSFRIDEGYTLLYSRQSWPEVMGFDGFYCPHPPLYFTLVKFANLFVREEIAARSVAAVAGVATVAVFYAIVSRLLDDRAAIAAACCSRSLPSTSSSHETGECTPPSCSWWRSRTSR